MKQLKFRVRKISNYQRVADAILAADDFVSVPALAELTGLTEKQVRYAIGGSKVYNEKRNVLTLNKMGYGYRTCTFEEWTFAEGAKANIRGYKFMRSFANRIDRVREAGSVYDDTRLREIMRHNTSAIKLMVKGPDDFDDYEEFKEYCKLIQTTPDFLKEVLAN